MLLHVSDFHVCTMLHLKWKTACTHVYVKPVSFKLGNLSNSIRTSSMILNQMTLTLISGQRNRRKHKLFTVAYIVSKASAEKSCSSLVDNESITSTDIFKLYQVKKELKTCISLPQFPSLRSVVKGSNTPRQSRLTELQPSSGTHQLPSTEANQLDNFR